MITESFLHWIEIIELLVETITDRVDIRKFLLIIIIIITNERN